MENFVFHNPVKIVFGRDTIDQAGQEVRRHGRRCLLMYGMGSVKRNGVFDRVVASLQAAGVEIVDFGGVRPNPVFSHQRKGVELAKAERVDVVLAVGGGSVIDEAKSLAGSVKTGVDVRDFFEGRAVYGDALPLVVVLTIPAAGSEMNGGLVLTDEETGLKHGGGCPCLYPKTSICDPTVMATIARPYLAYSAVDAMMHLLEGYFTHRLAQSPIQDRYVAGLVRTLMESVERLLAARDDYATQSDFMWAATLAWNGLATAGLGKVQLPSHLLEHSMSALYDVAHGAGLAVIAPAWMTWQAGRDPRRIAAFARSVLDVAEPDDARAAQQGIQQFKAFLRRIGAPLSFADVGIPAEAVEALVPNAVQIAALWDLTAYTPDLIRDIYRIAVHGA